MSANAVELERVSKRYVLGESHGGYNTLRDAISASVRRSVRGTAPRTEIWSLDAVSLEVERGSALGVIGRNGAGKSTLLKIVTRITEPTLGTSRTRGKVGALLEVGTGFHLELTGRENVYLNGAILGMRRREVDRRFDEIIDFSGVSRFLDTPMKRYSSGMYLRLAFAVAAHLDASIIVVDEVLAVGDLEFQRRCLGKMESLEQEGRTVIFVSHNLEAIRRLCDTSVWLDRGRIRAAGATADVVTAYLAEVVGERADVTYEDDADLPVSLRRARLLDRHGRSASAVPRDEGFSVQLQLTVRESVVGLDCSVFLQNLEGLRVVEETLSALEGRTTRLRAPGVYAARVDFPPALASGDYIVGCWLGTSTETFVYVDDALRVRLVGASKGRSTPLVELGAPWHLVEGEAP